MSLSENEFIEWANIKKVLSPFIKTCQILTHLLSLLSFGNVLSWSSNIIR